MADPNELLEDMRNLASKLMNGSIHSEESAMGAELADKFLKLDAGCLEGKLPDGWAMTKFSKSR